MPDSPMPGIKEIRTMTYKGHEFLDSVRDSKVWAGVKDISKKIGASSVNAMMQIAAAILTKLIKAHFGL